jgi:transposase
MYIRKNIIHARGKTYTHYFLVETVATAQGPRQKTICSLGPLRSRSDHDWKILTQKINDAIRGQECLLPADDPELAALLQKINQTPSDKPLLTRKRGRPLGCQTTPNTIPVIAQDIITEEVRPAGAVHVGTQFWKRLDLDAILTAVGFNQRTRLLTQAMVLNRLIEPMSEHAMPDWFRRMALGDLLAYDFSSLSDESLYRQLDALHPHRQAIEASLIDRERTVFNLENSVYLYDLTSTYFEGQALQNILAARGYSRDKRPDCVQVVIGLVLNCDGFPIAHEVFVGNMTDRQSVKPMLDALAQRVNLSRGGTVVVDRGMAFDDNLAEIQSRGLHYLVATRQSERDRWLSELENEVGFAEVIRQPSATNPGQVKTRVQVKLEHRNGISYVLCVSEGRTEKDRAIRLKQEQRFLIAAAKLEKRIKAGRLQKTIKIGEAIGRLKERYPRVARYYKLTYEETEHALRIDQDEDKYRKAEKLDGSYILKSDRTDLTAEETWKTYSLLTRAEEAFRDMKSPLMERPIFHQLSRRVETHIFLCVLAYHLLVAIENTLRDRNDQRSWATIREQLANHVVQTIVLPTSNGSVLKIRQGSKPEPIHQEIYDLLRLPHRIMKPIRTWHQRDDIVTNKTVKSLQIADST